MDTVKEIVGFFCRWALLLAAGLIGASVAWAATVGVGDVAVRQPPVLVLSDEVWQPWQKPYLIGRAQPDAKDRPFSELLSCPPGGRMDSAYIVSGAFYAGPGDSAEGLHEAVVKGLPYGRYAFCRDSARCLIVPSGRRVVAVDVRLADAGGPESDEMIAGIARLGEVVLFHPGPIESLRDYRALRDRMMGRFPRAMLVFPAQASYRGGVLKHIAGTLSEHQEVKPEVVTADVDVARDAAGKGFRTYWLVGQGVSEEQAGGATVVASPEALLEAMSPQ